MMTGTNANGIKTSGPAIMKITAMYRKQNGRSEMVASVADATKSRTDSNSLNWLANDPDDAGLCSMRMDSACLKSIAPMIRSAFLPATSSTCARTFREMNSNSIAIATPIASDHNVVNAWFGTTRSYTFMVKKVPASASTLMSSAASAALQ
jgi:hypothetical protein